ncbi:MAG: nucleotidyl transferase AbiEii/AbiGii toxin family protein [Deltaproteobacteria bacterium]|nr:nucleotidyl transferase AbiEii/AbiGii toxin family protein [Deltaproteobacteria bacterium]
MNLFDRLLTEALKNRHDLSPLKTVVEKELLHHDILRTLSQSSLLTNLTFIGGTCLRICYGGIRLSEDLDFTGGENFSRNSLSTMGDLLIDDLNKKYGLKVSVSQPVKESKNVDTWKVKIDTRPKQKARPAQRINIDICAVPSYEKQPMMLLNPYGVDMGTSGLVLQAQSREEIYVDKLLAFALRPNRVKYRDLWDMIWLHGQGLKPRFGLIPNKLQDRKLTQKYFWDLFSQRFRLLSEDSSLKSEFEREMLRFLPLKEINKIAAQDDLWSFVVFLIGESGKEIRKNLSNM